MICQWFLLCENEAVGVLTHPTLDYVPVCQRCADRAGQELIDAEFIEEDADRKEKAAKK